MSLDAAVRRLPALIADATPGPSADAADRFARSMAQVSDRAATLIDAVAAVPDLTDRRVRHDLRAHLSLVIGYADLWVRRGRDDRAAGRDTEPARRHDALAALFAASQEALAALEATIESTLNPPGTAEPPPPPPSPVPPIPSMVATPSGEVGTMLVIDDSADNRALMRAMLEQLGHTVVEAEGGPEALALLERGRSVDVVLLDVVMPRMDGFEVLDRLKSHPDWMHVPVLMVSALEAMDGVISCIARGAQDYLTRPVNEQLLRARVRSCLDQRRLRERERDHLACIDRLLNAIFPPEVVTELTGRGAIQPQRFERVGVCFMDVVGFTRFCDTHADDPERVVNTLEWYIRTFEEIATRHGVLKIKTIGDAFLMVAGLLRVSDNPVLQLLRCAEEILEAVGRGPAGWRLRVGIHVGPVVAGTLGRSQYSYDLWGSTVNIASRMESIARAGSITLSDEAWTAVARHCEGRPRDAAVRGLEGPMTVWEFMQFRPAVTTGAVA